MTDEEKQTAIKNHLEKEFAKEELVKEIMPNVVLSIFFVLVACLILCVVVGVKFGAVTGLTSFAGFCLLLGLISWCKARKTVRQKKKEFEEA